MDGNFGRFQIADFADEDDVGVLPQNRPQAGGERDADFVVDRDLNDAVDLILDRVLGRDQLVLHVVQLGES